MKQVRVEGAEHQASVAVVVAEEANSVDQGLLGKSCMMLGVDCLMVSVQEVFRMVSADRAPTAHAPQNKDPCNQTRMYSTVVWATCLRHAFA